MEGGWGWGFLPTTRAIKDVEEAGCYGVDDDSEGSGGCCGGGNIELKF